jgi:hypothetical protein
VGAPPSEPTKLCIHKIFAAPPDGVEDSAQTTPAMREVHVLPRNEEESMTPGEAATR